ncbi:MAG TPA: hypothetical protein VHQ92_05090, partial [Pseudolabrys sp.]|nr:hypothetical protein [Pseudolabrys sp.]
MIHPLKGGSADQPIEWSINNHSKLTPALSVQATRGLLVCTHNNFAGAEIRAANFGETSCTRA